MWLTRREYTIVAGSNGNAFMRTPLCDGQLLNSVVTFFRRKPIQQKPESLHDVQDNSKMHDSSLLWGSSNRVARQDPRVLKENPERFIDSSLIKELDESGFIDKLTREYGLKK